MDYKEKYEQALGRAKALYAKGAPDSLHLEEMFPELKESKDEMIRKAIKLLIEMKENDSFGFEPAYGASYKEMIAWLEKQGEHKSADKIKPKFKVGDVIRNKWSNRTKTIIAVDNYQYTIDDGMPAQPFYVDINEQDNWVLVEENSDYSEIKPKFKVGDYIINKHGFIMQIDDIDIDNNTYIYHVLDNTDDGLIYDINKTDKSCYLWTLKDVKDGDIVASNQIIILFKKFQEESDYNYIIAYAGIDISGKLQITDGHWLISNDAKPATKEQCDLLFQKIKEVGYEWDSEKKELKKIKQKSN